MSYHRVDDNPEDGEVTRIMRDHGVDADKAEQAQELIEEGLDEEDAIEIADEL